MAPSTRRTSPPPAATTPNTNHQATPGIATTTSRSNSNGTNSLASRHSPHLANEPPLRSIPHHHESKGPRKHRSHSALGDVMNGNTGGLLSPGVDRGYEGDIVRDEEMYSSELIREIEQVQQGYLSGAPFVPISIRPEQES